MPCPGLSASLRMGQPRAISGLRVLRVLRGSIQRFHSNVSIAHKLFRTVTPAVYLQGDAACVWQPLLGVGKLHKLDDIDPLSDGGWVANDSGTEFIPLAMPPEITPGLRQYGQHGRHAFIASN